MVIEERGKSVPQLGSHPVEQKIAQQITTEMKTTEMKFYLLCTCTHSIPEGWQKRRRLWFCRWHRRGQAGVTLHKCEIPGRPQKIKNKCQQCIRIHDERNADAGTRAEFDDFSMREYLHINISTMEQIVASSEAESVHEDNIANSHDPRYLCLWKICISSCALFHPVIYINSMEMYISWRKLNFCYTLNFLWILMALNIEMRESSDSAKKMLVSERCAHLK